jgi:hypothetical protein
MVYAYCAAILLLLPPMTGLGVFYLGRAFPPRLCSTLALGFVVLLACAVLAVLGMSHAVLEGRQPLWPYVLITGLPALAVARLMQLQLNDFAPLPLEVLLPPLLNQED